MQTKPSEIVICTTNQGKLKEFNQAFSGLDIGFVDINTYLSSESFDVEETEDSFLGNSKLKAIAGAKATGSYCLADDSGIEILALGKRPGIFSGRFLKHPKGGIQGTLKAMMALEHGDERTATKICKLVDESAALTCLPQDIFGPLNLSSWSSLSEKSHMQGLRNEDEGSWVSPNDLNLNKRNAADGALRTSCRFVCALVLANPDGEIVFETENYWYGDISEEPIGTKGFGYDPIVYPSNNPQDYRAGFLDEQLYAQLLEFQNEYQERATVGNMELDLKNSLSHRAQSIGALKEFLA